MNIIKKKDVPNVLKAEGTNVTYFLFDEYEVHYNEQAPHSTQSWHHHEKIWETLYIIDGELTVQWKEGDAIQEQVVATGDLIETENSPHTFTNTSDTLVKFLVIKQILKGENHREVFKTDKIIDTF